MMSESRGRDLRPRVTRRPSPGLAARMKMLEADAERRLASGGTKMAPVSVSKLDLARLPRTPIIPEQQVEDEGLATGTAGGGGSSSGGNGANISGIVRAYNNNAQPASGHHPGDTLHQAAPASSSSFTSTNRSSNTDRARSASICSNRSTNQKYSDENNQIPETNTTPIESSKLQSSPFLATSLPAISPPKAINTASDVAVVDLDTTKEDSITPSIGANLVDESSPLSQPDTLSVQEEETPNLYRDAEPTVTTESQITVPESPVIAITVEQDPSESTSTFPTFEEPQDKDQDQYQPRQEHNVVVEEDKPVDNQSSPSPSLPPSPQLSPSNQQHKLLLQQPQPARNNTEEEEDQYPPLQGETEEQERLSGTKIVDENTYMDPADAQHDHVGHVGFHHTDGQSHVAHGDHNGHRPSTADSNVTSDAGSVMTETGSVIVNGGASTLVRRASVFSLSRISFSAQLSRLTSLALPLSSEFSEKIKRMESSVEVSNAITSSAKQILHWIETAKTVLKGLDAEDDVEWAAQGKESLAEVDQAVSKFAGLMHVYVSAIDQLQARSDAPQAGAQIIRDIVTTMEVILDGWGEVQELLKNVKSQIEMAMEWTELWTTILQDIQAELEACQTILFEIEERRHHTVVEDSGKIDIDALVTIVEETPRKQDAASVSPEDASLLGLFARMQPLRASLDFLPMRLTAFQSRAEQIFPSACQDLENRRNTLEKKWKRLSSDAEEMKRELGEDKWIAIFRSAGRQAGQMIDSVERSVRKLRDAVDTFRTGGELFADINIQKMVESYDAKKVHYGTAIQRVLAIIEKGVHQRQSVNGEILRLHAATQNRWRHLEHDIGRLDEALRELNLSASQQMRDSVSTITSLDTRSPVSGAHTPGSSPASSVVLSSPAPNSISTPYRRPGSAAGQYAKVSQGALRLSNTPPSSMTAGGARSKPPPTRSNTAYSALLSPTTTSRGPSPSPSSYRLSVYNVSPGSARRSSATSIRSSSSLDNRPRWNASTNTNDLDKPLPPTQPNANEFRRPSIPSSVTSGSSRIPLPSPLKYGQYRQSPTPTPGSPGHHNPLLNSPTYKYSSNAGPMSKRGSVYGLSSMQSQSLRSVSGPTGPSPVTPMRHSLKPQASLANMNNVYNSGRRPPPVSTESGSIASTSAMRHPRPASAMAGSSRRSSMLPLPRTATMPLSPTSPGTPSGAETPSGRLSRAKRNSMPPKPLQQGSDPSRPKWK